MYAVIKTGGKQYRVAKDQTVKIEKISAEEGASVDFNEVLMIADGDNITVGAPYIHGGKVTGMVQSQGRGPKVDIIKFKRRKQYLKHQGHRQSYTEVRITDIGTASKLDK